MNFFDYELSRTATATPPQTAGESNNVNEPSLNDEVTQVVGQLGRLWGGFRRQSQAALETARKDFSSVVAQAQKEIEKLRNDPSTSSAGEAETSTPSQEAGPSSSEKAAPSASPAGDDGSTPRPSSPSVGTPSSPTTFQTLLQRVQASLPPNISSTLERTIPAALRDPSSHAYADIQHLRETLSSEFTRVQGVTRAQAEEYVHKSEALLREAGAYLKDAVRVIPPEEQGDDVNRPDVVFDSMGSGIVVLPTSVTSSRSKGKARATSHRAEQRLAGSRAAAMLAQLKNDPEVIRGDPRQDESAKDLYENWVSAEIDSKENGLESSYWTQRIKEALGAEDAETLRKARDVLVPSTLDSNTFWTRYFFRVYQIEKDEEKRKALLAASGDGNDEDFSWEDDDDESVAPAENDKHRNNVASPTSGMGSSGTDSSSRGTLQPGGNGASSTSYPESLVTSPSNTSPRESTDGYDVVSPAASSDVKSKVTAEPKDEKSQRKAQSERKEEDEGDSDWE